MNEVSQKLAALQAEWKGDYDANHTAAHRMAGMVGYTAADIAEIAATPKYGQHMKRWLFVTPLGATSMAASMRLGCPRPSAPIPEC